MASRVNIFLANVAPVDVRSLSLMRVIISSVCLYNIVRIGLFAPRYFGAVAVNPMSGPWSYFDGAYLWTLHTLFGGMWWIYLLLALNAAVAILVLVGWHTHINSILLLVLTHSLVNGNPFLRWEEHTTLLIALFFGVLLPWGASFSFDAVRKKQTATTTSSAVTVLLFFQVVIIYFMAALLKLLDTRWFSHDGVHAALLASRHQTTAGLMLATFPHVTMALTFVMPFFQLGAGILLFSPKKSVALRMTILVLLILMHLCFALFLTIGFFSFVMIGLLCALIPSGVWDYFSRGKTTASNDFIRSRWCERAVLMVGLIIVFLNVRMVARVEGIDIPAPYPLRQIVRTTGFEQQWDLFILGTLHSWPVARAVFSDGTQVDAARSNAPLSDAFPAHPWEIYENDDWSHVIRHTIISDSPRAKKALAQYYCTVAGRLSTPQRSLDRVDLMRFDQDEASSTPSQALLASASCNASENTIQSL